MKMTFYSNYLSDHQIPFCHAMSKLLDFYFVATTPMDAERLKLGFKDTNSAFPYVVRAYETDESYNLAVELGMSSDVVLIGSAPDTFICERMKHNKLTFRYCERFFKNSRWRIFDPRVFIGHYKKDFSLRHKQLYMLCASAYTASDCRFIHSYPHKTYKWGYFPEVIAQDILNTRVVKTCKSLKILWVGRLTDLKNPSYPIIITQKLIKNQYEVELDIIGIGALEQELQTIVCESNLCSKIHFLGSMPPAAVRKHMNTADIFLFTSNRQEGWGAVVNEAMSSGCAIVASGEAGSVPFLIKDGYNGYIYYRNSKKDLYKKVEQLILNPELRDSFGKNAYLAMKNMWSAENAAERLIELCEGLLNGTPPIFEDGPCSEAY